MTLYHVSPTENRASIERDGLRAKYDRTGFGVIYLTDARPAPVDGFDVWAVSASNATLDRSTDPFDGECWYVADAVTIIERVTQQS